MAGHISFISWLAVDAGQSVAAGQSVDAGHSGGAGHCGQAGLSVVTGLCGHCVSSVPIGFD